jgi:alkanesulfonate monooxygenase SsuD/methylene tetrahydromethanopterin reductase-like flavin-dependent oxidoreductase (luciferase family)
MGRFPDEYLRWRLVTGTSEEVVERIARFIDAGCTLPIIRFASWDPVGQMQRAMDRVIPALRDHAAGVAAAPLDGRRP